MFVSKALDLCIGKNGIYSPQFLKFVIPEAYSSISSGFHSLHSG